MRIALTLPPVILASAMAVVDGAAVASPVAATLTTTVANLAVAAGDIFTVDGTVTGGSSPQCLDIAVTVYIARE